MKRIHFLLGTIIAVLLLSAVVVASVWALPGGTWQSGIKVQNLSSTDTATIVVTLYRADGSIAYTLSETAGGDPLQAPPNGSVELYLPNYVDVDSGQYSAVVSSDQPIGVVATHTDYAYGLADSYNGTEGAIKVYVPYVYHNHNYWSTEIFVQNTSDSTAHVFATMSNGVTTKVYTLTLPAHGTGSFDTSQPEYADLGWFIGSAVITSTENVPLAVMVNETRVVGAGDASGNVMVSLRGLTEADAGQYLVLPSLYREFSGANGTWRSGIMVQNMSDVTTVVTVTLSSDPDRPSWTGTLTATIPANRSTEFYLPNYTFIPDMFKGYAEIESSAGQVVATVIHTNYAAAGGKGVANGYFGISSGFSRLSVPSLYANFRSGAGYWISGIKFQNVGTSTVTATVTFHSDPDISDPTWTGTRSGIVLDPGEAVELYLGNPGILDGGASMPAQWKGSASIELSDPNGRIAGTVIHTNYGRHVANMYMAIGR